MKKLYPFKNGPVFLAHPVYTYTCVYNMHYFFMSFVIHNMFIMITSTLLMTKKQQKSMQKTFRFITPGKGDISHAFKTAKITVFDPMMCKSPDAPLQNELLCSTFVVYGAFYFMQVCHATMDDS